MSKAQDTASFAFAKGPQEASYFGHNDQIFHIEHSHFEPLFSYLHNNLSKLK